MLETLWCVMGKNEKNQISKSHNYPSQRKPYSSTRKGIGGRKKKVATDLTILSAPIYFDKQLKKQKEQSMIITNIEKFSLSIKTFSTKVSTNENFYLRNFQAKICFQKQITNFIIKLCLFLLFSCSQSSQKHWKWNSIQFDQHAS